MTDEIETETETTIEVVTEDARGLLDIETQDAVSLMWTPTPPAVTIEPASVRTATVEKVHETIEDGTGTGVVEGIGKIEACQDVMLDVTTMTAHHDEIETCLKVVWIEGKVLLVVGGLQEAIAMNLLCKWEAEIERRAPVLRRRRKSLHLI